MVDKSLTFVDEMFVHLVGNKGLDEGCIHSEEAYPLDDEVKIVLEEYFFTPFKENVYYKLMHEGDLRLNEMYTYASSFFNKECDLKDVSILMAKHLHNQSEHPKIKKGEVYICHLKGLRFEDEQVDGIGIFKSESRDTFLKYTGNDLQFSVENGIHIKKLDKGAIILNAESEDGYRVMMVDANAQEARFWREDFLSVEDICDDRFHALSQIQLCKDFGKDVLAVEDKKEQAAFIDKSLSYLKTNENFQEKEFIEKVLPDESSKQRFSEYSKNYDEDRGIERPQEFQLTEEAVKKAQVQLKNIIKLDIPIEIRLKNDPRNPADQYLEKGYDDEIGMNYFKVYYNKEI